ncbi:uncharacterized protein LOC134245593 isoform X2 [Saccostrea cucullata]|uniref:uncharacterized protein LOC134245593 isoform X2 n=1 Tax=Saccostrea cuccullata TaxID=36930 RepID=UPI002ED10467
MKRLRHKHACLKCGKRVVHMRRHMRQVHKQDTFEKAVKQRRYIVRKCILCSKAIARFGDHLRRSHHISKRERIEDLRFQSPPVVDNFTTEECVPLTMEFFINVRDYVIFRILIANGKRAGAVLSITHDVIQKRQLREEGYITLRVTKHKTDFKRPSDSQLITRALYFVQKYIHLARRIAQLRLQEIGFHFHEMALWGKRPQLLVNSGLNKCLGRLWNKIFGLDKPISTTRLRKAVVTEVRKAVSHSRDVLSRHMSHEPTTADKYYQMADKSKMAVPLSRLITAVMEGESEASRTTQQIAQTSTIQEISQTGTAEGSSNPNPTPDSDSPKDDILT